MVVGVSATQFLVSLGRKYGVAWAANPQSRVLPTHCYWGNGVGPMIICVAYTSELLAVVNS